MVFLIVDDQEGTTEEKGSQSNVNRVVSLETSVRGDEPTPIDKVDCQCKQVQDKVEEQQPKELHSSLSGQIKAPVDEPFGLEKLEGVLGQFLPQFQISLA